MLGVGAWIGVGAETVLGGGPVGSGIQTLSMTGLNTSPPNDAATPGDHASISVGFPSGVTAWTSQAWGVGSYGDTTYGTGSSPTTYTASDGSLLLWEGVGDDGNTYRASAPIQYAAGAAPAVADGQSWTVDDTSVNLDGSASGANLTFSYALSGSITGVTINPTTGAITGTPTSVGSGTATITATDQYGRELTDTFTWSAALRTQATAADGLGPFAYVIDDSDTISINFVADFTANGNTLSYSIAGLPTGGVDDGDGTASGTATTQGESGSIVCTATDEYGRETTSTASFTVGLRTQATGGVDLDLGYPEDSAITPQNLLANWTTNGNTLTFVSVSPSLPTGLSINSSGVLSGTPTTETADATYTLTMQDEYGRQTADTFTLQITAVASAVNPVISTATFTNTEDGTRDSLAVTGTYAGADTIDATLEFYEGLTLRATATVLGVTVATGNFNFSENIDPGDLTYDGASTAADMPNVDNIDVTIFERNNGGTATTNVTGVSGLDVIAPVLSSATGTQTGQTTATWGVTSDEAGGTIYAGVRPAASAALTAAQLIAGSGGAGVAWDSDATPTADSANGGSFTGLTAATDYQVDTVQVDGDGTESAVASSATFTTAAAATVPAAFVDANWSVATGSGANELDVAIASLPSDGGATITDVQYDVDGGGSWTSLPSYAGTGTYTITMAAPSTSYAIRLRAVNSVGNAAAGNSESATSGAAAGGLEPRYVDGLFVTGGETNFTHTVSYAKTGITTGNNLLVLVHWYTDTTGNITSVGLVGDTAVTTPAQAQNPGGAGHHTDWYLVPATASPGDLRIITGGGADVVIPSVEIFEIDSAWTVQNQDSVFGGGTDVTANITDVSGGLSVGYSWALSGTQVIGGVTEPTADADSNAYAAGAGGFADRATVGSAIGTGADARAVVSGTGADTVRLAAATVWA